MAIISSTELGMDLQARSVESLPSKQGSAPLATERKGYFVRRDGIDFAGTHLIVDLRGASRLDEIAHIETTLRKATEAAGATLLHLHLHHFTPNGGVSGVAVLAESHISIHTWPEREYAALDVFMCGDTRPRGTLEVFKKAFAPRSVEVFEHLRGRSGQAMPDQLEA